MIDRSKKFTFSFIKDRIWKKINSWVVKVSQKNHGEYSVGSTYRFCVQQLLDTSHFKVQGS